MKQQAIGRTVLYIIEVMPTLNYYLLIPAFRVCGNWAGLPVNTFVLNCYVAKC